MGLKAGLCPVPGKGNGIPRYFPKAGSCACGKGNGAAIGGSSPRFVWGGENVCPCRQAAGVPAGSGAAAYDRGGKCRLDAQHAAHQGRIHGGRFRGVGSGIVTGQA